jgi:cytochrome c oxidase subunit 4
MQEIELVNRGDHHESMVEATTTAHHHSDRTVLFGREIPLPVYTVVFGVLGVLTAIEVVLAELLPSGAVKIALLVGIAIGKALLVMLFYMHLREDSRLFAVAITLPLFIGLLSAMFLLSVPSGGY